VVVGFSAVPVRRGVWRGSCRRTFDGTRDCVAGQSTVLLEANNRWDNIWSSSGQRALQEYVSCWEASALPLGAWAGLREFDRIGASGQALSQAKASIPSLSLCPQVLSMQIRSTRRARRQRAASSTPAGCRSTWGSLLWSGT